MTPFETMLAVTTATGLVTGLGVVPVTLSGVSTPSVFAYTTLSGTVPQVLASVFGLGLIGVAQGVVPVAAGFAAGAILAVVLREMVPSSHGHRYADAATASAHERPDRGVAHRGQQVRLLAGGEQHPVALDAEQGGRL